MLLRILDFAFSIMVSLGSSFANEVVFSKIFLNGMSDATIEQKSLDQDISSNFVERNSDVLDNIEIDDLGSMINELMQGLPSDTEFGSM